MAVKVDNLDTKALVAYGNYGKNNQSSGNSYSGKQGQRQNNAGNGWKWGPSRPKYDQSRTSTNWTANVAQVNHIRESAVAEAREQWEREQYDKDREERLNSVVTLILLVPNR